MRSRMSFCSLSLGLTQLNNHLEKKRDTREKIDGNHFMVLFSRSMCINNMYAFLRERMLCHRRCKGSYFEKSFSTNEKVLKSWEERLGIYALGERVTPSSTCPGTNEGGWCSPTRDGGSAQRAREGPRSNRWPGACIAIPDRYYTLGGCIHI